MRAAISSVVLLLLLFSAAAAQQPISCSDYRHNGDGSWTPLKEITIRGPHQTAQFAPDMSLRAGAVVNGVDLAGLLDVMCLGKELGRTP